jgi:uncharacterized protein (TIGR00369 family)
VGSTVADAGQIEGDEARADGAALARGWLENSPFVAHLGIGLKSMEPGRAVLALPYREEPPTMGEVVHGGAISSLVDTAAAAAVWSGAEVPDRPRASTIGLTVDFLSPARGQGVDRRRARRPARRHRAVRLRGQRVGRRRHRRRASPGDLPALREEER